MKSCHSFIQNCPAFYLIGKKAKVFTISYKFLSNKFLSWFFQWSCMDARVGLLRKLRA